MPVPGRASLSRLEVLVYLLLGWVVVLWLIFLVSGGYSRLDPVKHVPIATRLKQIDLEEGTSPPATSPPTGHTVLPSQCPHQAVLQFASEYQTLLQKVNLSATPRFNLPWHWAENDAFCGRYLLYRNTSHGFVWVAVGEGLRKATTLTRTKVTLINCSPTPSVSCPDVRITARLVGQSIIGADVRQLADPCGYEIEYEIFEPGEYSLEIKLSHINGSSDDPTVPRSLGVDRSRVRGLRGEKLFAKHRTCAEQRHIIGSPFRVEAVGPALHPPNSTTPNCTRGDYTRGRWIKYTSNSMCRTQQPYCTGDPWWLADAYGYNTNYLWAPLECHYHLYAPPKGPENPCFNRKGAVAIVGDSVAREYVQNCRLFPGISCEHWHMIINGDHFSKVYANSVVKVILDKLHADKPVALATNFGMMHMIGMCNATAWEYFMEHFAGEWRKRPPEFEVKKIWLSPPTIHYATRGMTQQRAEQWDAISWKHLKPLGFDRLISNTITYPREEGAWDGLHNAAEKGHKQSKVVNRRVKEFKWNGGIANMLWIVLLNMLCPGG